MVSKSVDLIIICLYLLSLALISIQFRNRCSSKLLIYVFFSIPQANVGGLQCSDCAEGTFYNAATQRDGCLECICMGITTDCASSGDRSIRVREQSVFILTIIVVILGAGCHAVSYQVKYY